MNGCWKVRGASEIMMNAKQFASQVFPAGSKLTLKKRQLTIATGVKPIEFDITFEFGGMTVESMMNRDLMVEWQNANRDSFKDRDEAITLIGTHHVVHVRDIKKRLGSRVKLTKAAKATLRELVDGGVVTVEQLIASGKITSKDDLK